jgi:recombinational DNA repair protein (RecF pathway)
MELRVCSVCKLEKDLIAFYPKMGRCKSCHNAKMVEWQRNNPERVKTARDKWRAKPGSREKEYQATKRWQKEHPTELRLQRFKQNLKQYGLTFEDYETMKQLQQNCCAICGNTSERNLDVDHNHSTGKVRELLCSNCNTAVGLLKEDEQLFRKATEYLHKHNSTILSANEALVPDNKL